MNYVACVVYMWVCVCCVLCVLVLCGGVCVHECVLCVSVLCVSVLCVSVLCVSVLCKCVYFVLVCECTCACVFCGVSVCIIWYIMKAYYWIYISLTTPISIIPTAFLSTCIIFACLSLASLYAERRSYLYLGGETIVPNIMFWCHSYISNTETSFDNYHKLLMGRATFLIRLCACYGYCSVPMYILNASSTTLLLHP